MLINISSCLWIVTTLFVLITSIFFLLYYNFASLKVLKSVKCFSKENIKILNLSLASKIGVGSISGIAISIIIGGKGTIFWLWISTTFLSIYTYLETKAGILLRNKIGDINIGGPYYYLKYFLKKNKLSILYSILIIFTFLFSFILIQSNTIIISLSNTFMIDKKIIMLLLIIIVIFSINKEITRISSIVSVLVPFMGLLYLIIGIIVIYNNLNIIPSIIIDILKDSFKVRSVLTIPFIVGFQRAIFSNESGLGSTSIVVSLSDVQDYKQEVYYQLLGMYYISLIVCTISAFIILTTNFESLNITNINGIEIINYAFNYHFGKYGPIISSFIITLFAYSTIITSFYYGNISIKYLFHNKNNLFVKIIVIIVIAMSLYIDPINIWAIVDIFTALTTIINIYSLIRIRKYLKEE